MKYIFCAFWIVVVIIGITFSGLNSQIVTINYYLGETTLHLPILLLFTLLIGVVFGLIIALPTLLKKKNTARHLKQKIKQAEQEISNLRNIPIKETH